MAFLTDRNGDFLTDHHGARLTDHGGGLRLVSTVVGAGALALAPPGGDYDLDDRVVLTATPDSGNVFLYLSLNGSHFFSSTLAINMQDDLAVIARFATLAETTITAPDRARCPFCHGAPGCVVCGGTGWVRA